MLITKEWLKEKSACTDGYEWSLNQEGFEKGIDVNKFLNLLINNNHLNWANWVIVRVMTKKQYLSYAIFAAEQVIGIYEKKYHNNKNPRKAIEAAKKVLEKDSKENRAAAYAASAYAAAAADAASADASAAAYAAAASADAAADASAYAYASAAYAAASASAAASAAASATAADYATAVAATADYAATAYAAAAYAAAAKKNMMLKILNYGISLLDK